MPFKFMTMDIPGIALVEPASFGDERGLFREQYKHSDFVRAGITEHFVQDNLSRSVRKVLRGLHYQLDPKAQGKLVTCLRGSIFDVAVDIRKGSPTYGRWIGRELTGENSLMLYVPAGFAHGFLTLSETAEVLYKCTEEYSPSHDRGIIWNDPQINIAWGVDAPLLSDKDRVHPLLRDAENNFRFS
ncbi:MAG: dTDP-4-dehydrorhamnose 3,5-epimerase [Nitrospirota bacterium]